MSTTRRDFLTQLAESAAFAERQKDYKGLAEMLDDAADAADDEGEPQATKIMDIVSRYKGDVARWRSGLADG